MADDNNNADFESTLNDVHTTLRPAPDMTAGEFADKVVSLAEDLRVDYIEQTGDEESHDWDFWMEQLTAAYVNN